MRQCVHTARLVSAKTRTGSRGDPIQAPPAAALIPDNILGHLQMAATPTSACSSPPPATARVQGKPAAYGVASSRVLPPQLDHRAKPLPVHSHLTLPSPTVAMPGSHDLLRRALPRPAPFSTKELDF